MTTNGRDSDPGNRPPSEAPESTQAKSQAPSGVFRTSDEEEPSLGQRRWGDRWTVAEQFIREGFYYRLLRRPVGTRNGPTRLTKREDDVLRLASAGHNNKSIAQLLNVSASTVGVLLFRAAAKLNVASRADLLAAYKAHTDSQAPSAPRARPGRNAGRKSKH
jgi:DNA-binding CsgD family transcriptional regulator